MMWLVVLPALAGGLHLRRGRFCLGSANGPQALIPEEFALFFLLIMWIPFHVPVPPDMRVFSLDRTQRLQRVRDPFRRFDETDRQFPFFDSIHV